MGCICVPPTLARSSTDAYKIVLCDQCLTPTLHLSHTRTVIVEMGRGFGRRLMPTQRLKMISLMLVIVVVTYRRRQRRGCPRDR